MGAHFAGFHNATTLAVQAFERLARDHGVEVQASTLSRSDIDLITEIPLGPSRKRFADRGVSVPQVRQLERLLTAAAGRPVLLGKSMEIEMAKSAAETAHG
jgi:hypothetical protein